MKKLLPILILLSITFLMGCQEKGQPAPYIYSFSIVDSIGGQNLVGDSVIIRRYHIDSVKFYSADGSILRTNFPKHIRINNEGYEYGVTTGTNSSDNFLIKYNNQVSENDTINVIYGEHNVNIYRNNQLIFNKEDISQTTKVHFNIIK